MRITGNRFTIQPHGLRRYALIDRKPDLDHGTFCRLGLRRDEAIDLANELNRARPLVTFCVGLCK
jgi:hypothetical protein